MGAVNFIRGSSALRYAVTARRPPTTAVHPRAVSVAKETMIAAFFHDERFTRDATGTYYSTGGVPYSAFARYLKHFDRVIVVGRLAESHTNRTVASGRGVEWACIDTAELSPARALSVMARRAREVLASSDCAIVRLPSLIGLFACREALRSGKPFMTEVVGNAFDALWNHGTWRGKLAAIPTTVLNRHYIARAPFATYVTREFLQRSYPPGGTSVAISDVVIDAPRAEVLESRIARIAARDRTAPATLGLVGSYDVNYKGHETALRATALLRRAGRPVTLRFIGVGDPARWRARAVALGLEPYVDIGGSLPQGAAVTEWMDTLDVYLIPSLQEGLPRALIEAMSRGLPAVGSRRAGIPELLDARFLHPPADHRALAALVGALLDDRDEMRIQASRNWSTAGQYVKEDLEARREEFVRSFRAAVLASARGDRRADRAWAP
jgi:glycosyltransferase involved in cell wall biosynthesis